MIKMYLLFVISLYNSQSRTPIRLCCWIGGSYSHTIWLIINIQRQHIYWHSLETYPNPNHNHFLPNPNLNFNHWPKNPLFPVWGHEFCPQLKKMSPVNWSLVWNLSPKIAHDRKKYTLFHFFWVLHVDLNNCKCMKLQHYITIMWLEDAESAHY